MTENINRNLPPELSDDDAELLSAYLDNMLTTAEREILEKRLDNDAFLRSELQAMRRTVAWLNEMPALKAPRNFTISAEDVANDPPPNVVLMPRRNLWLSAAAAAVVIVLFGAVFIVSTLRTQNAAVGSPVQSTGDAARTVHEDTAAEVALMSSATITTTPLATNIPPAGQNQTGLTAPTVLGGATMPVMPQPAMTATDMPTATITDLAQAASIETAAESDTDDATLAGEAQEEAESSTLAQASDGILTATIVMETSAAQVMMAEPEETEAASAELAVQANNLATATIVMQTAEAQVFSFAATATQAVNVAGDTRGASTLPPGTPTPLATTGAEGVAQPPVADIVSTSALDNLRMTATAYVELYAPSEADSETTDEAGDGTTDISDSAVSQKQSVFNMRRLFLYLWIRLLEFLGTAR